MKLSIPWFSKSKSKLGRVGLAIGPDGLAIAHINRNGKLVYCKFYNQPGDVESLLESICDELKWQGMACSVVLHPVYYQLLLVEKPAVQDDEMDSAVRWLVKDLLGYSIDDAAIDHFSLPNDAYRGRKSMLYVAALRKKTLQDLVVPFENTGLVVDCVEISELALNNLVVRLPEVRGAIALVQLYDGEGFINLLENDAIYLSRRLDMGLERFSVESDNQQFFDELLLEIQRSLDYYESQLGKGIVTTLYYSPGRGELNSLGVFLSDHLGLNIIPLGFDALNFIIDDDVSVGFDDQDLSCIGAMGAALGPLVIEDTVSAAS